VIPNVVEGHRELISNKGQLTFSFTQIHKNIPIISISLEPHITSTGTTARVTSVSKTSTTIEFSSDFLGYLHLHAVSAT